MFKHRMFPELEVEVVTTPKGRYYKIHEGTLLPSVTTILGRMISKDGLAAWRKRIGNPEADRISSVAIQRGSAIHDAAEKLVLNEETPELFFAEQATFQSLKSILEKNLGTIFGVEMPLYSRALYTAGRADLVAEWGDRRIPSIIDYKTSRSIKQEKDIKNYFLQATCYAFLASSIYGIAFHQVVIILLPLYEKPVIFIKDVKEYFEEMVDLFMKHKEEYRDK